MADVPAILDTSGPTVSWPQWSAPLAREAVPGEDQLGVEGAAQSYQQYLVPGIITTTEHARYYSFYAWILHRFIHLPGSSRLIKDFRGDFFRRHEVALILAYYGHHLDTYSLRGVVGQGRNDSKARRYWESGATISLDQPYFQNKLGGFGQYYRTAMEALGLIAQNERPRYVYKLTDRGKALAEAYASSISSTAYARDLEANGTISEITRSKAKSYGRVGCVCPEALQDGKDLSLLLDAFFRFDQTGVDNPHARRRLTLGVALDLVRGAGRLDRETLRPALLLKEYSEGRPYRPSRPLQDWSLRWRLVEARHTYTVGLQCLWAAFLLLLRDSPAPIEFGHLMAWAQGALGTSVFGRGFDAYLGGLCKDVDIDRDWKDASAGFDEACLQGTHLDEYTLYLQARGAQGNPKLLLTNGLRILSQVFLRFFPLHSQGDRLWMEMAMRPRLPLAGYFDSISRGLQEGNWKVGECLEWLYREYILGQHELIALEKLRQQQYDTFKFHYVGGIYTCPFPEASAYTERIRMAALRLNNALTILTDLGLLYEDDDNTLQLTPSGVEHLERVARGAVADAG